MKHTITRIFITLILAGMLVLNLTGCYETRYVHHYNHHTRGWYDRRHVPPPAGVNFEVDVYHRARR